MGFLVVLGIVGLFLLTFALYYVLVPFLLMTVLGFFGIVVSFWISLAIVVLVMLVIKLVKM